MSFDIAVEMVLAHEGGYVDHPEDPGGATNFGITLATLEQWRGKPVTKTEIMALTRDEAQQIYRARYWTPCRCEQMPSAIGLIAFDGAVNLGVRRSTRLLQRALGVGGGWCVGTGDPGSASSSRHADLG